MDMDVEKHVNSVTEANAVSTGPLPHKRLKLLALSPNFPYPVTAGGRLRVYNLLKCLSTCYDIKLLSLVEAPVPQDTVEAIMRLGVQVITVSKFPVKRHVVQKIMRRLSQLISLTPNYVMNHRSTEFANIVASELKRWEPDIIQAEYGAMGQYLPILDRHPSKVITSVMHHDVTWELFGRSLQHQRGFVSRLLTRIEIMLSQVYERKLSKKVSLSAFMSSEDQLKYGTVVGDCETLVIPNGVDCVHYRLQPYCHRLQSVVMTGMMNYHPNVEAAKRLIQDIMPRVWEVRPELKCYIVGKDPPPELIKIAGEVGSRLQVTGEVADVKPFISQALAFILPLEVGSGTRLRILESMALGTPVIATPVAVEGLKVEHGRHVLIGERPKDLANELLHMLGNQRIATDLVKNARELVEQEYQWESIAARLDGAYNRTFTSA